MTDEELFQKAVELADSEPEQFLLEACEDADQRDRVLELVSAHRSSDSLLDTEAHMPATETVSSPHAPKTIGDFEILRELGRGGMGVVYEARQKSLNRKVALKVLSSGLGLSSKAILRFRREAEAAGKLHHTNIVPIYTTGEDRGIHFYAMEMIEGPSLDQLISNLKTNEDSDAAVARLGKAQSTDAKLSKVGSTVGKGSAHFDQIATMIADVASALDHAHEQGVIHRDVKPSNLLLAPDGRLSINDFGLARMLEQPGMTMSGEFVGSPLYMSPEQITAGRAPLDHRTDIYSLGATLYELLTLQPPFPGDSRDQVIAQILHKDAISPRKINRDVPVDMETICLKAIERDPDRRYQSAAQLATDLRNYVNRHAISARRLSPLQKLARKARRNPAVTTLCGVLILFVVIVSFVAYSVSKDLRLQELARIEERRLEQLADIQEETLMDLTRGDFKSALVSIEDAMDLGADEWWRHFIEGHIHYEREDYEQAIVYLDIALIEQPENVAIKSLLAMTHQLGGSEARYASLIKDVKEFIKNHQGELDYFDLLFSGRALVLADARMALENLNLAEAQRSNLQIARLYRADAYLLLAMDAVNAREALEYVRLAIDDANTASGFFPESNDPYWIRVHANLIARNVCNDLVTTEPASATKHRADALVYESAAREDADSLWAMDDAADVFGCLCSFVAQTGDEEMLFDLSKRMQESSVVPDYAAIEVALEHFRLGEFGRAIDVLPKSQAESVPFVRCLIELSNPKRANFIDALKSEFLDVVQSELRNPDRGDGFLPFDWVVLMLLKESEPAREAMDVITAGEGYDPIIADFIFDYLAGDGPSDPDDLVNRCRDSRLDLTFACFYLAVEALAEDNEPLARERFQLCVDQHCYLFHVHSLSRAMLAQMTRDPEWPNW